MTIKKDCSVLENPDKDEFDTLVDNIPVTIGTLTAHLKAYWCNFCETTHCYGRIAEEHREFADETVKYESFVEYAEKHGHELPDYIKDTEILDMDNGIFEDLE